MSGEICCTKNDLSEKKKKVLLNLFEINIITMRNAELHDAHKKKLKIYR